MIQNDLLPDYSAPTSVQPSMGGAFERAFPDAEERKAIIMWLSRSTSPHTRKAYLSDILLFAWFCRKRMGRVQLTDLRYRDLDAFRAWLMSVCIHSGQSVNTVRRRISSVKSLYSYLLQFEMIEKNPAGPVKPPKEEDSLHERILSEEEVMRIIKAEENPRNRALLKFLYSTGARVAEVAGVRWGDVYAGLSTEKPTVTFRGKGNKTRTVTFSRSVLKDLEPLRKNLTDYNEPLFPSAKGGHLDTSQIFRIVRTAAKKAGINRPVSPHWFRHAHATHALAKGAPVHLVKWQLGHSSAEMTMRYTHIMPREGSSDYISV